MPAQPSKQSLIASQHGDTGCVRRSLLWKKERNLSIFVSTERPAVAVMAESENVYALSRELKTENTEKSVETEKPLSM
jgi:hypothetical protein